MQKGQTLFTFVREVTVKTGLIGLSVHAKLSYTVIYPLQGSIIFTMLENGFRCNNAILKEAVLYLPT